MEMGVGFNVCDHDTWFTVRPFGGLDVILEHGFAVVLTHHELRFEWNAAIAPARFDEFGAKGEVGNKIPIHDIELNTVDPCIFEIFDALPHGRPVRWKD